MSTVVRAPLIRYPQVVSPVWRGGAVAIGNFDGVHRGHIQLLTSLRGIAGNRPAVVISFYPHPIRFLRPDALVRNINTVREKAERCGALGVDLMYLIHFNSKVAAMSAVEFVERVLVERLAVTDVVVGEDVAIGRGREGNLEFLRDILPAYGISLHTVPKLMINGHKAGSRTIRELIANGEVRAAAELIGEPFTISARVGHGDKRGTALGFPTANIAVGSRLIPKRGVYACKVTVAGIGYMAVANIGTRPTFKGCGERAEVHILDFKPQRLYGARIHVSFIARLRDEQKFESVRKLTSQIASDIASAREVLRDG